MPRNTFSRNERIKSQKTIDYIFSGGAKSYSSYPLRIVFKKDLKPKDCRACILISVSKKRFKHAVDRNRMKRLIREAYRINKHPLIDLLNSKNENLAIAFIYLSNKLTPFSIIEERMKVLISLIIEEDYKNEETNS